MNTTHETRSSRGTREHQWEQQRVRPSCLSNVSAGPFADAKPFARFGAWGERVTVARTGTCLRLAHWMALHRQESSSYSELWQRCQQAKPALFRHYQIVRLDRPSFFLPAGDVVFDVSENPTQVPDHPPKGVMLRHLEALETFPNARFYFLQPVFTSVPHRRLYTADDLREDAAIDRDNAIFAARLYGDLFRSIDWSRQRLLDLARCGLRLATRSVDALNYLISPYPRHRARRRPRRDWVSPADLTALVGRTRGLGLDDEALALRSSLLELRTQFRYDPVLAFEVAERPAELWFEAHWFAGHSGRTYVHF